MATDQTPSQAPNEARSQAPTSAQASDQVCDQAPKKTQNQSSIQASGQPGNQNSSRASNRGSRKRNSEEISSDDGEPEPELVAFIIGPKSRTFTIAASTLIPLSDDFKIDYDPRFRDPEADSLTTRWPTESVTLFEYFQRWIYSSSILDRHQTVDDISWEQLLDLYCFGKDHEIPTFTNHIINTFIDKSEISGTVPTHLIRRIYNATKLAPEYVDFPPEHLRKWIVHKSCAVRKKSWFNTEVKRANYPDEFLFNMLYQESTDKYPNTDFRAFRWKFTVYERLMSDWDIVLTIKKRTGRQVVLREEPPRVLREATTSEDEDEVRRQRFVDRYFG